MLVVVTPTSSARRPTLTSPSGSSSFGGRALFGSTLTPHAFPCAASVDTSAGELNPDELERIVTIMQNPGQFKIPQWFVNRQR